MIELSDIHKRLRAEIKSSSLTQKEIAKQLNINPFTLSKYMRLNKLPSLETFANLCQILEVSADEILGISL